MWLVWRTSDRLSSSGCLTPLTSDYLLRRTSWAGRLRCLGSSLVVRARTRRRHGLKHMVGHPCCPGLVLPAGCSQYLPVCLPHRCHAPPTSRKDEGLLRTCCAAPLVAVRWLASRRSDGRLLTRDGVRGGRFPRGIADQPTPANAKLPVMLCHGEVVWRARPPPAARSSPAAWPPDACCLMMDGGGALLLSPRH